MKLEVHMNDFSKITQNQVDDKPVPNELMLRTTAVCFMLFVRALCVLIIQGEFILKFEESADAESFMKISKTLALLNYAARDITVHNRTATVANELVDTASWFVAFTSQVIELIQRKNLILVRSFVGWLVGWLVRWLVRWLVGSFE